MGLLDADIYGPFHAEAPPSTASRALENRVLEPMEAYGIKVMSIGFLVEEEPP